MSLSERRPSRRAVLWTGTGAAALLAAPAYLRAQPAAVKIGILQPVTGALAQDGELGRMGAELAIEEINDSGGIKAIGGAKLEMVFGDAQLEARGRHGRGREDERDGVAAYRRRLSPVRSASPPPRPPRTTTCPISSMSASPT